jgi:hypothetical protein
MRFSIVQKVAYLKCIYVHVAHISFIHGLECYSRHAKRYSVSGHPEVRSTSNPSGSASASNFDESGFALTHLNYPLLGGHRGWLKRTEKSSALSPDLGLLHSHLGLRACSFEQY